MQYKNILTRIAVFLLLSALVIALTQFWGIPLKHILVGIVAYVLYGVLIVAYLARFALVFLGVFAVYKMLRERHDKQLAV